MSKFEVVLAGDIGGTKTNLALFEITQDSYEPIYEKTYSSSKSKNLEEIVSDFLAGTDRTVHKAGFGVAGPVIKKKAKLTKLPWSVDLEVIKSTFSFKHVAVVNDLVATAFSLRVISDDLLPLDNSRHPDPEGCIAVLAPGTGLGEAFLQWNNGKYIACPSEGGHSLFSPANELQIELLRFFQKDHPSVSFDMICSGRGLPHIYSFLHKQKYADELDEVKLKIKTADDIAPIITQAALADKSSPLCTAALDLLQSNTMTLSELHSRLLHHPEHSGLVWNIPPAALLEVYLSPMWKQGLITGSSERTGPYTIGPQWKLVRPYQRILEEARANNLTIEQLSHQESWIERQEITLS